MPETNIMSVRMVSPMVIVAAPQRKLIVEVEASGGFESINWRRSDGSIYPRIAKNLPHFSEILLVESTTEADLGLLEVSLGEERGNALYFTVIPPGKILCYQYRNITLIMCIASFQLISPPLCPIGLLIDQSL